MKSGLLLRLLGSRVAVGYIVCAALFAWSIAQFYRPETGFSSLISIGEKLDEHTVTALRQVPHYVYDESWGYDGAYYVQLAMHPTLDNPELTKAIDNLPYRAKRILFCWAAWALGLGQPAWIVQAHALLNVIAWFALAGVLLRWFPPTHWENFLRWAAVMFSHGVCMSVRNSLVDAPSLLLVALAMRWLEQEKRGAGIATLALAGLGKETSLLASAGIDFDWRAPRTWLRTAVAVGLIALPLVLWSGYVRWKFGPAEDPGLGNFTLPFAGFVEKFGVAWREALERTSYSHEWATLLTVIGLAVQWAFIVLRPKPNERWWRVGVAFAVLMAFVSTPVWEGYPGAATRVLLPMTLAFNVLAPRGVRWLPLLLAGNLTVAATLFEFSPPAEFYQVRGDRDVREAVQVEPVTGWHGPERHFDDHWRWSDTRAELRLRNRGGEPIDAVFQAQVSSAGERRQLRVTRGEQLLWSEPIAARSVPLRFGVTLPPGETVLVFSTDVPAERVGSDPRDLAFQVANLEIVVSRARVRP